MKRPWERNGRIIEDALGRPIECEVCSCRPKPRCTLCVRIPPVLKLVGAGFANETNCTNCPDLNADFYLTYVGVQSCLSGDYDVWQSDVFSIEGCSEPGDLTNRRWLFGMRNMPDVGPGNCYTWLKLTADGTTICDGTQDHRTGATWGKALGPFGSAWTCFNPIIYTFWNCTDYWVGDCNFGGGSSHSLTISEP